MKNFDLESLSLFISDGRTPSFEYQTIETGFDISSNDFLKFAHYDLTAKYGHHLVNCLSNTKRAIESQLDCLLIGFGLSERAKKWNFPTKINYLNSIGVVSPNILNKINKKRNLLEHEYKNPSTEEVEDALDIATLFTTYTNKYIFPAIVECTLLGREFNVPGVQAVTVKLDWRNYKIIIQGYDEDLIAGTSEPVSKEITSDQAEYDDYLKFYLNFYNLISR